MKKIIVANWKMHPDSLKEAKDNLLAIRKTASKLRKVHTVVCPPAIFLSSLAVGCTLGAQDCFHEKQGPYTGQLSAAMLYKAGARYVIVGHSERRELGETNSQIARKIQCAFDAGLTPILCLGEKARDDHGFFLKNVEEQLTETLAGIAKKRAAALIITYEPVWAISAAAERPATPEECNEMVLYIRKLLAGKIGIAAAKAVPVLYGGSVDAKNIGSFLQHGGVQGALVGHASLDAKQFSAIMQIAESI